MRDAEDAAKTVLTKEKIDGQLSGQSGATTPFMKVWDAHYSNRKSGSFSTQDLMREQLDNLTSMVYHMSMEKEGNNRSFKPQIHQKRKRGQKWQNFREETEIDHLVGTEWTINKTSDPPIEDNHRTDETIGEEIIGAKFMVLEVTVEIEAEIK